MRKVSLYFFALTLIHLLTACQPESDAITRINKEDFTLEEQEQIGLILQEAIKADYENYPRLNQDIYKEAHAYIDALMETLLVSANVERRKDFNWTVSIIRNDDIRHAFILPGGHLYLYSGLLKYLQSENELLSIIAHEIAYADSDEAVNRLKAEYGGIWLGDILLNNNVNNLEEVVRFLPQLVFTAENVMEADVYSVELLCDYAWESRGLKSVFERVDSLDNNIEWLQTRQGDLNERIQVIENTAQPCGTTGGTFDQRYKKFKEEWLP